MKNFISVIKHNYRNKVLIAISDISAIYENNHHALIYLKSDPKCSIETEENFEDVCKLIENSNANRK